jgi:hypothetical protein
MPTPSTLNQHDALLKTSRLIVRIALYLNRAFFAGVIALLLTSAILSTRFVPLLLAHTAFVSSC